MEKVYYIQKMEKKNMKDILKMENIMELVQNIIKMEKEEEKCFLKMINH